MKTYFFLVFDYLLEHDTENTYIFFHAAENLNELEKLRSDRWRANAILADSQEDVTRYWDAIDLYFCPFGAVWPRPAPLPSVVTVHDIQEVFYPHFFTARQRYERESHFPSSTRSADRIVAVSNYTKRTIVEQHGVSGNRIKVASLCADPIFFQAVAIGRPPDSPLPFDRFVFFPANRWPHKNHDLLLRALLHLKSERNLTVNAVFTGFDVEGGYPLQAKASEYGVNEQVFSVGYIAREQLAFLYARAEMVVFPSLFEGFGLPVLEAMAAGRPCAVSNVTSLPEIAGDAALYFEPTSVEGAADAIARLWSESGLRESLIRKGREQSKRFSARQTAEAHLAAFKEAAASFSRARYLWHLRVYQPFHRWRTARKYAEMLRQPSSATNVAGLEVSFSRGWHAMEGDDVDWLRWNGGVGDLRLVAPAAVTVRLEGASLSMHRPNDIRVELNGAVVSRWREGVEASGFQPLPFVELALRKGRNRLRIVSGNKAVRSPSDPRLLAVAVRNLRFRKP